MGVKAINQHALNPKVSLILNQNVPQSQGRPSPSCTSWCPYSRSTALLSGRPQDTAGFLKKLFFSCFDSFYNIIGPVMRNVINIQPSNILPAQNRTSMGERLFLSVKVDVIYSLP